MYGIILKSLPMVSFGIRSVKLWVLSPTVADIAFCSTCNIETRNCINASALAALKPKYVFL
jgi:hypothetical protein